LISSPETLPVYSIRMSCSSNFSISTNEISSPLTLLPVMAVSPSLVDGLAGLSLAPSA